MPTTLLITMFPTISSTIFSTKVVTKQLTPIIRISLRYHAKSSWHNALSVIAFATLGMISFTTSADSPTADNTVTPPQAESNSSPVTILPYTAHYKASTAGLPVKIVRQLSQQSADRYQLSFSAKAFISKVSESSEFIINREGVIVPQAYRYSRSGLGSKKKQIMDFDWQTSKAHYRDKKRDRQLAIDLGKLDKVTTYLQLRRDLISGKQQMSHNVIDRGKLKTFNYKVTGRELLDTPLGKVDTQVVTRVRDNNERTTQIWFAIDWNYAMVKLVQSKEGKSHTIIIEKLETEQPSIATK